MGLKQATDTHVAQGLHVVLAQLGAPRGWRQPTPMKTPELNQFAEPTRLHALTLLDIKPSA